jgi:flavin reductase (DIM6/NTAB) family NADH-FMN oxidoreductase RutF
MSYFNMVAHDPPTIMVSISTSVTSPGAEGIKGERAKRRAEQASRRALEQKEKANRLSDTAQNIKQTKEFTVNIISEPFLEAANYTAIDSPPEVDEWALSGLTRRPSK